MSYSFSFFLLVTIYCFLPLSLFLMITYCCCFYSLLIFYWSLTVVVLPVSYCYRQLTFSILLLITDCCSCLSFYSSGSLTLSLSLIKKNYCLPSFLFLISYCPFCLPPLHHNWSEILSSFPSIKDAIQPLLLYIFCNQTCQSVYSAMQFKL